MNIPLRSFFLIPFLILLNVTQAQADEMEVAVVPVKKELAIQKWKEVAAAIGLPPIEDQLTKTPIEIAADGRGHLQYSLQVDDVARFTFDAFNGDTALVTFTPSDGLTQKEADEARPKWITEGQIRERCEQLKNALLPKSKLVYFSLVNSGVAYDATGDKKEIKYQGLDESAASYVIYDGAAVTSNHLVLTVERSTGKVKMLILSDVKFPAQIEKEMEDKFFDPAQENIWQTYDDWFVAGRLVIRGFDTDQLRFLNSQTYFNVYSQYRLAPDECMVISNGGNLNSSFSLFVRPKVRENNPLIFADYFPKFLIDTKREGDTITLHGQLPDKGKTAVLTLGSKEAIVDGKPFPLSGAPQEMDGRLYLPYELLHECNGVLVRWDAKKNTLWVDTRYLRRP